MEELWTWTARELHVLDLTGLISSPCQPFVRLLCKEPSTRTTGAASSTTSWLDPNVSGSDIVCLGQCQPSGKSRPRAMTASSSVRAEVFKLPVAVDWIELQLWNRFDKDVDVLLGKTSLSLHHLQPHCGTPLEQGAPTTGALWLPLSPFECNGVSSPLKLKIECILTFEPQMPQRLCHELEPRRKERGTKRPSEEGGAKRDEACERQEDVLDKHVKTIAEPTFAFTPPFLPLEWSLIAATSIRHLFFHSDVERLGHYRALVLFGDLDKELQHDEGLQIDDDHLTAFKACQFSAQYLDHCVTNLSQRLHDYSDDFRVLRDTQTQLTRKNKALKTQRKRLQKENHDLDLLIATYQRVLDTSGATKLPSTPPLASPLPADNPSTCSTASLSSKTPVFLKTWEERERIRRLHKELTKAQRLHQDKQRINQLRDEQQERDDDATRALKLDEYRQQRAARRLQAFVRHSITCRQSQRRAVEAQAATLVQATWRRVVEEKEYRRRRREAWKQQVEVWQMAQSEREQRQWIMDMEQRQRQGATARTPSPSESLQSNDIDAQVASPSKHVVDALVETWRKLHRVFVLTHQSKGIDYHTLFSELDLRKDDVLDRAELRLGVRSFGVRLDRKLTRALIALLRTKCRAPPKPLLLTFEHFVTGFELFPRNVESSATNPLSETNAEGLNETVSSSSDKSDGMRGPELRDTSKGPSQRDEALVLAVRTFREALHESATAFLTKCGKATTEYREFRHALTRIFGEFDTDANGQLEVDELVACMASFNLELSRDEVRLLRELFVQDGGRDTVGLGEFVSFVLAHSSASLDKDELGLLGQRIRDEVMTRVQRVQTHADNVEDAVRLVFQAAYKHKRQQECSIRDFMRVFTHLRLGVTPCQLARLVVRLDYDNNGSISFEELLVWLRLRSKPSSTGRELMEMVPSGRTKVPQARRKATAMRHLLATLASGHGLDLGAAMTPPSQRENLTALFDQIDRNHSGKINQDELQVFLSKQDLLSIVGEEILLQLCDRPALPLDLSAHLAQELMTFLDSNANGVATLNEWLAVAQLENTRDDDNPVVLDALRKALNESENNDVDRLIVWLSKLPGAMPTSSLYHGEVAHVKIRAAEFKTGLRAKLGGARSVSLQTIDRMVKSLDKDGSGWITTSELCAWAFPPRDLEEILRLVLNTWQRERQECARADFAAALYKRFDVDHNGSLAARELLQGFVSFGLILTEYEARVLLIAFDLDGDGCWSKAEFTAFVDTITPAKPLVDEPKTASPSASVFEETKLRDSDNDVNRSDSDDDLLLQSGSSKRSIKYSEDFDED